MRTLFISLLLINVCFSQELQYLNLKVDSLKTAKKEVTEQLNVINEQIDELEKQIAEIKFKERPIATATTHTKMKVYESPSVSSKIIGSLAPNKEIKILDYLPGYYKISLENNTYQDYGYLNDMFIKENTSIQLLKEHIKKEEEKVYAEREKRARAYADSVRAAVADREKKRQANKLQELLKKYPKEIADKILKKEIWIGMTREMCIDSWGKPEDINRTITTSTSSEQWVYDRWQGRIYLYFSDGKLSGYQD